MATYLDHINYPRNDPRFLVYEAQRMAPTCIVAEITSAPPIPTVTPAIARAASIPTAPTTIPQPPTSPPIRVVDTESGKEKLEILSTFNPYRFIRTTLTVSTSAKKTDNRWFVSDFENVVVIIISSKSC